MIATLPDSHSISEVLVALSTILGVIFLHIRQTKKNQEIRKDLKKDLDEQTEEWKTNLNTQIKKANGVPWAFIENLPLPAWAKDLEGRMVWINTEYSIRFGIKPNQYEGRTDYDIWPDHIAEEFRKHDRRVVDEKATIRFIERIPEDYNNPDSKIEDWRVWKFPIFDENRRVKAVGGIAVPKTLETS